MYSLYETHVWLPTCVLPAGLARSASAAPRGAAGAGATKTSAAPAVNKSIDTLMSFLKADNDILGQPLSAVEEEPPDLFGGSTR
jgi:hypothetical protein